MVGNDWLDREMIAMLEQEEQELREAARGSLRKRNRKRHVGQVCENWHDYDHLVYDYYGYE